MDLDADQLMAMARQDSERATVQLIEHFYERIYAFVRRLSSNDADAADITQRTFLRVQQALPSFAGRSSVGSWIHGIAYHIYVDWRRSRHRTESRPDDWWIACRCADRAPDDAVAHNDLAKQLYSSVDRLDPDLRETVHLHYYQGLTLQETADAMDVATSTVKYRLRQALGALKRALADEPEKIKPPMNLRIR